MLPYQIKGFQNQMESCCDCSVDNVNWAMVANLIGEVHTCQSSDPHVSWHIRAYSEAAQTTTRFSN